MKKNKRLSTISLLKTKIEILWNRYNIPQGERDTVLNALTNTLDDYNTLNTEHHRLLKIQKAQVSESVEAKRKHIRELMDQLHYGPEQRKQYDHLFTNEEYDDEFIQELDNVIKLLTATLEKMAPIIKLIERREWFKKEMKEFETTASDPNRLKKKSTRLLQEEQFRNKLAKEFPSLTTDLKEKLKQWEEAGGESFMFDGESYLVTMSREQEMPNFKLLHLKLLTGEKPRTSVTGAPVNTTPKKTSADTTTKSPAIKQSPSLKPSAAKHKPSAK